MAQFTFFIDEKVTVWERYEYNVEADSLEEATGQMKQEFNDPVYNDASGDGVCFSDCRTLYDSAEQMTLEQNNGCATRELIYEEVKGREITILTNETDPDEKEMDDVPQE